MFPKQCGCGRLHSERDWKRLRYVGEMGDEQYGVLELRNCQCQSTLAIRVKRAAGKQQLAA